MKKKLTALLIAMCILTTSVAYAGIQFDSKPDISTIKFTDVSAKHWAKDIIYKLAAQETKILGGYPDRTFKPDANMTRAEFVTVLVRTLGLPISSETCSTYTDVPQKHWASKYVGMAQQKGIIEANDYGDSFKPEKIITRFEACRMLINSYSRTKVAVNDNTITMYPLFKDADKLDQKNKKVVHILYRKGILNGYADNTAGLQKYATRAELATFIMRFIENSDKLENYIVTDADLVEKKPFLNSAGIYTTYIDLLPDYTQTVLSFPKRNPGLTERINSVEFFHVDKNYNGKYKAIFDKVKKGKTLGKFASIKTDNTEYMAINVTIKYTDKITGYWTYDPEKIANTSIISDNKGNISTGFIFTEAYLDSILQMKMDTTYQFTKTNREKTYTIFTALDKTPTSGELTLVGGREQPNASDYRSIIIIY